MKKSIAPICVFAFMLTTSPWAKAQLLVCRAETLGRFLIELDNEGSRASLYKGQGEAQWTPVYSNVQTESSEDGKLITISASDLSTIDWSKIPRKQCFVWKKRSYYVQLDFSVSHQINQPTHQSSSSPSNLPTVTMQTGPNFAIRPGSKCNAPELAVSPEQSLSCTEL